MGALEKSAVCTPGMRLAKLGGKEKGSYRKTPSESAYGRLPWTKSIKAKKRALNKIYISPFLNTVGKASGARVFWEYGGSKARETLEILY
jgi:hypothetical protein